MDYRLAVAGKIILLYYARLADLFVESEWDSNYCVKTLNEKKLVIILQGKDRMKEWKNEREKKRKKRKKEKNKKRGDNV